jgi:hypothetical protein
MFKHRPTTALSCLLLLLASGGSVAAQEAPTADAAVQREAVQAEELCDYCKDYTVVDTAAGPIRTSYQVGIGYPDEKRVATIDVRSSKPD